MSQASDALTILVVGVNPHIAESSWIGARDNPTFGFFSTRYATPLEESEMRAMIKRLGKLSGADFKPDAMSAIFDLTGGHPYLTRLLCSCVIRDQRKPCVVGEGAVRSKQEAFIRQESSKLAEMVSVVREFYPEEFHLLHRIAMADKLPLTSIADRVLGHLEGYQLVVVRDGFASLRNTLLKNWLLGLSARQATEISAGPMSDLSMGVAELGPVGASLSEKVESGLDLLEVRLRQLVRTTLDLRWGGRADDRVKDSIGKADFDKAVARRESSIRPYDPREAIGPQDILLFCYLGDLQKVICGHEWEQFRRVFRDRKETESNFKIIVDARNNLKHNRTVPELELMRTWVAIQDLLRQMSGCGT